MKKIALLLATLLLITCLPFHVGAAGGDPYAGIPGIAYDYASVEVTPGQADPNMVGSLSLCSGAYILFENVSFGSVGAYRADVTIAAHLDTTTYMGGTVEMRLDSRNGKVIASFKTDTTTPKTHTYDLAEPLTGTHDIYMVFPTSKPMKLHKIAFQANVEGTNEYATYSEPDYLEDIKNTGKKNVIYTLIELGLIEPFMPDEYNPYIGVPRGSYANTIAKILGYEGGAAMETGFTDIDPASEYAGAVAYLQQTGVIFGNGNGEFHPETYITVNDALTMAVRALGYEALVASGGKGYPLGYVQMAADLDLTKGITMGETLTRGDFATLVDNIINAEYLETVALHGDYEETVKKTGILSKTQHLNVASGVVTANSFTTLAAPIKTLEAGEVLIDGEIYQIGSTYASALLGYDVKFYYKENNDEKTIVSIAPSKSVRVATADISEGDAVYDLTEQKFTYYDSEEDTTETVKLTSDTHIIYNGKAIDDTLSNLVDPETLRGVVRLVEAKSETTLVIEEYTTIWAETLQGSENKIYDGLTGQNIVFDPNDNDVAVFYNGNGVAFSSVENNTVLDVYESKNKTGKKLVRIKVSTSSTEGAVTSIDGDNVYIDGTPYKKSKQATQEFYPGVSGYFLLNTFGELAACSKTMAGTDFRVGVLTAFKSSTDLDQKAQLQIFEDTDAFGSYNCAERVTVDGISVKGASGVLDGYGDFTGLNNMDVVNSLVRYRTNENGEISMLDTYYEGIGGPNDTFVRLTAKNTTYRFNGTSKIFTNSSDRAIAPYKNAPALFGFKTADDPTSLFYEKDITANRRGDHAWGADADTGELYTLDAEIPYVSHVIWQNAGGASGFKAPFVVSKKTTGLIDGETAIKISGYRNSEVCNFYVMTEDYNSDENPNMALVRDVLEHVQPGDILSFTASDAGEIFNVRIEFLADGAATNPAGVAATCSRENGFGELNAVSRFKARIYGEVVNIFDDFVHIKFYDQANGVEIDEYVNTTKCMRFSYNNGRPQVTNGMTTDKISIGDKVFYTAWNYATSMLCICDHPDLY